MIKELSLINCQSWEHNTLALSYDRVNVLRADNSVGKSVFGKMLRNAIFPSRVRTREVRMQYIRHGAPYAQLGILGDDDAIAIFRIYPDRVLYGYKEPGQDKFTMTTTIPDTMIRILGLRFNEQSKLITNIIDAGQQLFLVNSDQQANNAIVLEYMTSPQAEKILEYAQAAYKETLSVAGMVNSQLSYVRNRLNAVQHVDVSVMEYQVEQAELLNSAAEKIDSAEAYLRQLCNMKAVPYDIESMLQLVNLAIRVEDAVKEIASISVSTVNTDVLPLVSLGLTLQDCKECIAETSISPYNENLEQLEGILSLAIKLDAMKRGLQKISLQAISILCKDSCLLDLTEKIEKVKAMQNRLAASLVRANEAAQTEERLREQLSQSNCIVQCPIYGEVVYDGKTCLSVNN